MYATILITATLVAASIFDIRTRRVPNFLWLLFMPLAIITFILAPHMPTWWTAANIVICMQQLYSWNKGAVGGADVKALMAVTLAAYWLPIPLVGYGLGMGIAAISNKERTRFIPWMTLGTAAALASVFIITGGLP